MVSKIFLLVISIIVLSTPTYASDESATLDLDAKRSKALKDFGTSKLPNPSKISKMAKIVFAKPIEKQSMTKLSYLASEANLYVNLIAIIDDQYAAAIRTHPEKIKWAKIEPLYNVRIEYEAIRNRYLTIRNKAYFNIGIKHKKAGKLLQAVVYFKDAYRLSAFSCDIEKQKNECIRWMAEQELKSLLSTQAVMSYDTYETRE